MSATADSIPPSPLRIERWPSEIPLLVLVALAAAGIWVVAVFTIFLLIYAIFIGAFLFVAHLVFVAHVRGSAVRIGPDQLPELYQRVVELSERIGLARVPEAYVMQAGGALNALAMKFLRSDMLVLFSDLLEACGTDTAARDMVVAHELAHIRCGHLRWRWLLLPGLLVPFLGMAYSRACEFTCDRWGAALCGDRRGAVLGMSILAAGASHGRRINAEALVRQRELLDRGWMTIGKWLSTHPPLCERIAQLEPALGGTNFPTARGVLSALGILAAAALVPIVLTGVAVWKLVPAFQQAMEQAAQEARANLPLSSSYSTAEREQADGLAREDLSSLAALAEEYRAIEREYPADEETLYAFWVLRRRGQRLPHDPFDGARYGYVRQDDRIVLWSTGPDGESGTDDDIEVVKGLGTSPPPPG